MPTVPECGCWYEAEAKMLEQLDRERVGQYFTAEVLLNWEHSFFDSEGIDP